MYWDSPYPNCEKHFILVCKWIPGRAKKIPKVCSNSSIMEITLDSPYPNYGKILF